MKFFLILHLNMFYVFRCIVVKNKRLFVHDNIEETLTQVRKDQFLTRLLVMFILSRFFWINLSSILTINFTNLLHFLKNTSARQHHLCRATVKKIEVGQTKMMLVCSKFRLLHRRQKVKKIRSKQRLDKKADTRWCLKDRKNLWYGNKIRFSSCRTILLQKSSIFIQFLSLGYINFLWRLKVTSPVFKKMVFRCHVHSTTATTIRGSRTNFYYFMASTFCQNFIYFVGCFSYGYGYNNNFSYSIKRWIF